MVLRIKDFSSLIPSDFRKLFDRPDVCDCLEIAYAKEKGVDIENRSVTFVASDSAVDSDGEIVAAGAFHKTRSRYLSNPVLMSAHRHLLGTGQSPVIGSVSGLVTDKSPMAAVATFAESPADLYHWLLYRDGHQKAFSIGFNVRETTKKEGHLVILEGDLGEISAVALGANANALVTSYIRSVADRFAVGANDDGLSKELQHMVRELTARIANVEESISPILQDGKSAGDDNEFDDFDEKEFQECVDEACKKHRLDG